MRIAHVVATYPPYRGGMGQVVHQYAARLLSLGHDARVFTPRYRAVAESADHVDRLQAVLRLGNAAVAPSILWRMAGYDIVHLHYPFFGGAEWVLGRRVLERRQALVVSYYMDAAASGLKGRLFRAYERTVFPSLVARADRILVSSREYAESSALARLRDALERVEVHPFGVDLDRFHPGVDPDLRRSLRIPDAEPVILFVGSLDAAHDFKGLPVLVEALQELQDHPWRLIVVGQGGRRERLQQSAGALGLAARVHFAGGVSDEELPRYYRLASLHVLPSTTRAEAFGLVTLEAAASAVPSIVSDLPGVRTLVQHEETGLHVPANDASALRAVIRRLLEDRGARERLGCAARALAEREFSWPPLINRLVQTYREVLAGATATPRQA
jgi:glycosyltransferase involved in cell wall biosynthesis